MDIAFFVLILATFGVYLLWRRFNRLNRTSLLKFSTWRQQYESARPLEKISMAKALLLQSLHLANVMGAEIPDASEFHKTLNKEDPSTIIDECLEYSLPSISALMGHETIMELPARDVGMFFLVGMSGPNSRLALQNFLSKYSGGVGNITCNDCGYSADLVAFNESNEPNSAIYQCESCGNFVEGRNFLTARVEGVCPCGGAVEPHATLFCPKCKSKKVQYKINYPS